MPSVLCKFLIFICLLGSGQSVLCSQPAKSSVDTPKTYSIKVIKARGKGFGYDILAGGKLFIHQPVVPGLPGNNGFVSKEKSQKAARLVVAKIRNGEIPPTVTPEELKSIGAI